MSRPYEPRTARFDRYTDDWIVRYNPRPRERAERRFNPSELQEFDSRNGSDRRYMRGYNDLDVIREELRAINDLEGLYD
jgi:hypothetical protein